MRKNEYTVIKGKKVRLVPYNREHVVKYHEWMKSLELQELTASEPLTLEDEYAMQDDWRQDPFKCTFIVLDAEMFNNTGNSIDSMVGDINLFIDETNSQLAEIEVMIAEETFRGRGLGTEAILLMLAYGIKNLSIETFTAKIKMNNEKSIKLFEKFQFKQISTSQIFNEVTMENKWTPQEVDELLISFNADAFTMEEIHN